jgi:hypothetical protein
MTVPKECRHRLSCCIAAASTAAHRDSRGSGLVASGEWRHYEWQSGRAVGERTQQEMCALAGDLDLERKLALLRTERVCFYVRILDFDGRCRVARWVKAFVDLPNLSVGNESNISRYVHIRASRRHRHRPEGYWMTPDMRGVAHCGCREMKTARPEGCVQCSLRVWFRHCLVQARARQGTHS